MKHFAKEAVPEAYWEPSRTSRIDLFAKIFNSWKRHISNSIKYLIGYIVPTITVITFWDFLVFYQIFLSPQVKQCTIITYKHGIYELPHKLPNNLRLRILGNKKILGKCLNLIEWEPCAKSLCENKNFFNTREKFLKNRN